MTPRPNPRRVKSHPQVPFDLLLEGCESLQHRRGDADDGFGDVVEVDGWRIGWERVSTARFAIAIGGIVAEVFLSFLERFLNRLHQCSQVGDPPGYTTPLVILTLSRDSR